MFALLTGLPGVDDLRSAYRRIDTARHHGVPAGCVLELDLQAVPHETAGLDPLAMLNPAARPPLLHTVVDAIHRAAEDPRVSGLIARVQLGPTAPGPVQELRAAIAAFSAVKPSLAWAETYPGTLSYYLATAFREIWVQPSGTVGLIGFATNATFLRGALDRAGIEAQFVTRGEYKSAVNVFTEDGYTDAHREADTALIAGMHAQVRQAVADARGISPEQVDALADRAPLLRDDALAAGLIDTVGFRDQAYARIAELAGAPAGTGADADGAPPRLYLNRYAHAGEGRPLLALPSLPGRGWPTIAVITVAGPIVSGHGGRPGLPMGRRSVGGDTIAAALRQVAADDDIAAIVLRVDSPGGSVTGSETIWRAVAQARAAGKPVVASMGAVAASGGYYISAGADAIVANPGTITGSIGVLTGKLVTRGLKDRLGVGNDAVRSNANADAWSSNAPFTAEQHAQVEAEADLFYTDFVERVAAGRGLSVADVDAVARGRVWIGADALRHGLVDELGGLRTAIRRAKLCAGLAEDAPARLVRLPGTGLWDLLRPAPSSQPAAGLTDAVAATLLGSVTGLIEAAQTSVTGASALWLGQLRG